MTDAPEKPLSPATKAKIDATMAINMAVGRMPAEEALSVLLVASALTVARLAEGRPRGRMINAAMDDFRRILQQQVPLAMGGKVNGKDS